MFLLQACRCEDNAPLLKHHERCVLVANSVTPSPLPKVGKNFLELHEVPEDMRAELIGIVLFADCDSQYSFPVSRLLVHEHYAKNALRSSTIQIPSY